MMKRDEVFEVFYLEHLERGFAALTEIRHICQENRESFGVKLRSAFMKLINQIKEVQLNKIKGEIACFSICFFRSNFYMKNGKARIYAYDQRLFLDTAPLWEEIDFFDLCEPLWRLEETLCKSLSQYNNKVFESDVRMLIQMDYIPNLIGQITALAKAVIVKNNIVEFIDEISVTDDFQIICGEYQGDFEEIYVTETLDTKGLSLKEFLKIHKNEEITFCCKRYLKQSANHLDLRGTNFTKSVFIEMDFADSDFSDSFLLATEWRQCKLVNTCWKGAGLFGASFINSDLSNSDFSKIIAPVVPENFYFKTVSNWDGICFSRTILRNTKFTGSDLRGADFRKAQFDNTDFSGAFLVGAVFDRDSIVQAGLSPEQINQVKLMN